MVKLAVNAVTGCLLLMLSALPPQAMTDTLQLNDIDWPPYFFPEQQALLPGIGKTVLTHCVRQLGYTFRYNNLPIKRTHFYMQTGELDITVYSYQPEREDAVVFGKEPLFISSYGFAVAAASGINISNLDALSALTFGHLAGLAHTPQLNQQLQIMRRTHQVVESYDLNTTLQQLISTPARIDITANSRETLAWRIKTLGLSEKIRVLDYELAHKAYFIAVSKNSSVIREPQQFVAQFDACLLQLKQSGQYRRIAAEYGLLEPR